MKRRIVATIGLLVGVVVLSGVVVYHRQIVSKLTHLRGGPRQTVELAQFEPADQPDLRIAVTGDVGDGGDKSWRTAASMYVVGRRDPYDVLFLLGDNVYPSGQIEMLEEKVLNPFAALLDTGVQLQAVLGNHDAMAPDRGAEQMTRLGMPGFWWATEVGGVLLVGLDSNRLENSGQLEWLDRTLADSQADWKIVALHESPFSAGYQGSNSTAREVYVPVFEEHGVDLVLSGHDHDYQRSQVRNGVTYVVSGGGAGMRRTGAERYTAYSTATPHFVDLNVFADRLVLRAIDQDLRVFDEFEIGRAAS